MNINFTLLALFATLIYINQAIKPSGFHTSWSLEGGLYISWAEVNSTLPKGAGDPRCIIKSFMFKGIYYANSTTYNDTCDDKTKCTTWKGWLHTVEVPVAQAEKQKFISYSCGNDIDGFSKSTILRTRFKDPFEETTFVFLADIGAIESAPNVSKALQNITFGGINILEYDLSQNFSSQEEELQLSFIEPQIDFVMMAGDVSYANGNQFGWDTFFDLWEPIMKSVPTLFSPGNHDGEWRFGNMYTLPYSSWVNGGESGNAYSLRLPGPGENLFWKSQLPGVPDMYSSSIWYSVGFGGVRIITTSGTHEFEPGSEQYAWLVDELKKANTPQARAKEPWVIVTNHYPMYCTIDDCCCGNYTFAAIQNLCQDPTDVYYPGLFEINAYRMLLAFDPLFERYNVDLFLTGHEHCYERTLPIKNFTVESRNNITGPNVQFLDPNATVHVLAGTGGSAPDERWRNKTLYSWSSVRSDGEWTDANPFGFVKFTVSVDKTIIKADYLNIDQNGDLQIEDSFSIKKTGNEVSEENQVNKQINLDFFEYLNLKNE